METERVGNMSILMIIGLLVFGFIMSKVEANKNIKGEDEFWVGLIIFIFIICVILDIANIVN